MTPTVSPVRTGIFYAVLAYLMWGFFPLYWKLLTAIPPEQILAHRMFWSAIWMTAALIVLNRFRAVVGQLFTAKIFLLFTLTAALISVNWYVYIWAVNNDRLLDSSLGYYINPLTNIVLGVVVLGERLRRLQMVAVAIAALAVAYLTLDYGKVPWVALILTLSMSFYGLLRKTAPLGAVDGLFAETAIFFLPAAVYLAGHELHGTGSFFGAPPSRQFLLFLSGPVTALPLLLFAAAARKIPLTMIGLLQYLSPTIQFLLAILVFGEPFTEARLYTFALIWIALIVYTADGIQAGKERNIALATSP